MARRIWSYVRQHETHRELVARIRPGGGRASGASPDAIRAYNPASQVAIKAAQDLTRTYVASHLVLIGGLTWEAVTPWFSRILPIPIEPGDPFDRGAVVVHDPVRGRIEFTYTRADGEIVEDVGFFACRRNPSAPRRMLTICGGITRRGVHGAALSFIDWEMRERNEQYVMSRCPDGSTYCIVMRVPVANKNALAPDLTRQENRFSNGATLADAEQRLILQRHRLCRYRQRGVPAHLKILKVPGPREATA